MPDREASRAAPSALRGLLSLVVVLGSACSAGAGSVFSAELSALAGRSADGAWTLNGAGTQTNSIGFEYLVRLSGERGDYLTANLQTRASYDPARPDDEPWAIEIHNAWIEHRFGLGRNARLGHFEPAFGLERALDTHGTLLQTLAERNVGFKHDWGLGYRGTTGAFDLEASAQTGSGMGLERRDGSVLLSSRLSTPPGTAVGVGVSALYGRTLTSMGMRTLPRPIFDPDAVERRRIGVDALWNTGAVALAAEAAAGSNDGRSVLGALLRASWQVPALDALTLEAQAEHWSREDGTRTSLGACVSLRPGDGWTLSAAVLGDASGDAGDTRVVLHAYYYGRFP